MEANFRALLTRLNKKDHDTLLIIFNSLHHKNVRWLMEGTLVYSCHYSYFVILVFLMLYVYVLLMLLLLLLLCAFFCVCVFFLCVVCVFCVFFVVVVLHYIFAFQRCKTRRQPMKGHVT